MEKFIPYEKLLKKKQRELNAARRGTWTINPVTGPGPSTRSPANRRTPKPITAKRHGSGRTIPIPCHLSS